MPEVLSPALIWIGTTLGYLVLRRSASDRGGGWTQVGWAALALLNTGFVGVAARSPSVLSGFAEATAHTLAAGSLLAVIVPLVLTRGIPRRRIRVTPGAGVVKKGPPRYGGARLLGTVIVAPLAATVAVLALPKVLPLPPEAGYLATVVLIVPALAVAPFVALASPSLKGAWIGSTAAAAVFLLVIVAAMS